MRVVNLTTSWKTLPERGRKGYPISKDTLFQKLNDFGNKYKEVFEFGIGTTENLVESLDDVISVIGSLIAAYGAYKAALIAVAAWQKASSLLVLTKNFISLAKGVNVATAAMKAFNITSKANLFGALLSVIAGVTTAIYMFSKADTRSYGGTRSTF